MIASRASAQCAHRPLHRSSEALCRRPSGTQPRPGITSTSSTRSLATNAPGYLHCHTVGGVCAQVHASDPAIRKEATPPYETHVGRTQRTEHCVVKVIGRLFASRMAGSFGVTSSPLVTSDCTRVTQVEPVGRARGADACGHVQHDGLARPRAARPTESGYGYRPARPNAFQPSRANY